MKPTNNKQYLTTIYRYKFLKMIKEVKVIEIKAIDKELKKIEGSYKTKKVLE